MQPTHALTLLDQLVTPHRGGHRCYDEEWWNDATANRPSCPVRRQLEQVGADLTTLHEQVHAAAHDPIAVDAVATAMLAGTDLADLPPDAADGWRHVARLAVEALSLHLDRDPEREERAEAARARIANR